MIAITHKRSRSCVRACVPVCSRACVRASLASDSSGIIEVIIVKLGTVTVSDMKMHHVLIIIVDLDLHSKLHRS